MFDYSTYLGAVHLLGEPIKEYGFDLADTNHNFCNEQQAQFEVNVKGPKDKGKRTKIMHS